MERLGFQREGVIRAHKLAVDGTSRDSFRYSMTAAEWPAAKERLLERMADNGARVGASIP
jgi:hypothetical protein